KIPMQFFILLVGVMVFVFFQYNHSPLNFNPAATKAIMESPLAEDYMILEKEHLKLEAEKRMAQNKFSAALDLQEYAATQEAKQQIININNREKENREAAKSLISLADKSAETNDKDYVFIHFILKYLPKGLIGLLLAVILSAAMSSTSSELNALGTITALDIYKRNKKEDFSPKHYVKITKLFTLLWGVVAILIACVANLFGIFLIAFFFKFIKGNAVFVAAIITQCIVIIGWTFDWMSYLWLNAFGCCLIILLATILEGFDRLLKNPPIKIDGNE